MDKVVYLLVVSAILGSSLCVAQVTQTRSADIVPIPYSRSNNQNSIPSGSGTSNSESTQTVCENGKCEQVIRTCVNGLCTDKKLVSDSLGTSGHSSSQSKKTRCVNGNCEEVTTTCTNGVCTESKSSNTGSSSYNPPIQTQYDVPAYRQYTAFPNDGIGFQGNLNDGFGSVYNREPRPIYNNEESRHYYNNEESSQYHNNGGPTPIYNNVQSRNQEKHTECVNGVCKTVTKTCNNGNCETTTQ